MNHRQLFLQHVAQTSEAPLGLHIVRAQGVYQYSAEGKKYIDLISGFSVANIGHSHPKVVAAVQQQAAAFMHVIVYGEFIQTPQVAYAHLLAKHLPESLNCVYFTNSGTEATEGAMKLAKRVTGKTKILCANNSYHGSTQGALSLMGSEYWRNAFRPLLPQVYHFNYDSDELVDAIDTDTACVILEPIQAESGSTKPRKEWLQAIRKKCNDTCTLLIFDEIQVGFGKTGTLWAFEQFGVVPDVLLLGKALGGGMPLGAFVAHQSLMSTLTKNPVLGHISTFGGHPVSCAAGMAAMEVLLETGWVQQVNEKAAWFMQELAGYNVRMNGLLGSVHTGSFERTKAVVHHCLENGLITDWFLFEQERIRISAPLCITKEEVVEACSILKQALQACT